MGSFRGLLRYFRAAALARKGRKLLGNGHYDQAKSALGEALVLLGREEPAGASSGVWFSERVVALRDLSYAAAKAGDVALARASITEGLALWEKGGLGSHPKFRAIEDWRGWAQDYLAWSSTQHTH